MAVYEIEIDDNRNGNLFFEPIARTVRGRFDFANCNEPKAKSVGFPAVPGQRIRLDIDTGKGVIVETIHDHPDIADRIKERGYRLAPRTEVFDAHIPTWLYWMARAIESGVARAIEGTFPDSDNVPGEPHKVFFARSRDDESRRIDKLVEIILSLMPAKDRKQVAELMGAT